MPDYYLIYDDACALCLRAIEQVRSLDRRGKVALVPLSHCILPSNIPMPPLEELHQQIHLLGSDGTVVAGSDAIASLASLFPESRIAGWLMSLPGIKHLARAVYRWVARYRLSFGQAAHS